jgi:hypothetical protein
VRSKEHSYPKHADKNCITLLVHGAGGSDCNAKQSRKVIPTDSSMVERFISISFSWNTIQYLVNHHRVHGYHDGEGGGGQVAKRMSKGSSQFEIMT